MRGYLFFEDDDPGGVTPPPGKKTCPGVLLFGYEWPPLEDAPAAIAAKAMMIFHEPPLSEHPV